jgi:hypothetical protein
MRRLPAVLQAYCRCDRRSSTRMAASPAVIRSSERAAHSMGQKRSWRALEPGCLPLPLKADIRSAALPIAMSSSATVERSPPTSTSPPRCIALMTKLPPFLHGNSRLFLAARTCHPGPQIIEKHCAARVSRPSIPKSTALQRFPRSPRPSSGRPKPATPRFPRPTV